MMDTANAHCAPIILMSIGPEGTFEYVFDVNADLRRRGEVAARAPDPVGAATKRLLGGSPTLRAVHYERQAWQLYARLTLTAADSHDALVAQASFSVDRNLIHMLREGDSLYVSRTACGGVGLSVIREGGLIAAAGAITHVPLGNDAFARLPLDLIRQAESLFQTRDAEYEMGDCPLELSIAGETRILHGGSPQIGPYDVVVRHGFVRGLPGTDVCASIERRGVCPDTAAHTSAQLLEEEGLQLCSGA
jgi:hypothetical protein